MPVIKYWIVGSNCLSCDHERTRSIAHFDGAIFTPIQTIRPRGLLTLIELRARWHDCPETAQCLGGGRFPVNISVFLSLWPPLLLLLDIK
jgi:hypothetical protein